MGNAGAIILVGVIVAVAIVVWPSLSGHRCLGSVQVGAVCQWPVPAV